MEKETIEANDLRFRQKVEDLRTQLESRRETYTHARKAGFRLTCMVLGSLVLVTAAGYYLQGQRAHRAPTVPVSPVGSAQHVRASVPSPVPGRTQPRAPARATAALINSTAPLRPSAPAVLEEPRAVEPSVSAPGVVQAFLAGEPSGAAPAAVLPPLSVAPPVPGSIPTPLVLSPVPRPAPLGNPETPVVARAEPAPSTPAPPRADFRLTASQACLDIEARECVGAQAVFALHEGNVPHVWMTVHSHNLPYVLTHVYYHEGERYAEVPLAIIYPRMRTWSNVTLRSPTHVGAWRVEIVREDGTVVKQVEFRVIP